MDERYVFLLETEVHTYGRHFDTKAPTGREVFEHLLTRHSAGDLQIEIGTGDVSVPDMEIRGDTVTMLFRLASDTIPDNRFLNKKTRVLRDAPRRTNEAPAVTAHFVIDISSIHDTKKTYPTIIENARHLPKTTILSVLNLFLKRTMTSSRKWTSGTGKEEVRPFIPRLAYHADYNNSINGLLDRNGAIIGIEYIEETVEEVTIGSIAAPVRETRGVKVVPEERPRGQEARDFVRNIFGRSDAKAAKKAKVRIQDPDHGKPKVVKVDPSAGDILASAFVPQRKIEKIKPPLKDCQDKIHTAFSIRMKSEI